MSTLLNPSIKTGKIRRVLGVALAAAMVASLSPNAEAVILIDDNSVLIVDENSSSGANAWAVDSQDQLFQQWFWYRVGDVGAGTREYSIDTLGPAFVNATANSATITYGNSLFDISVTYTLTGGAIGTGQSTLNEDILIVNNSSSVLDLQFFQYSDFDLAGTKDDDSVILHPASSPFELAYQWDDTAGLTEGIITLNPAASRGSTDLAPTIVNLLEDDFITDFSTIGSSTLDGDVEFAFQWDLSIPAGGAEIISKVKNLEVFIVPEPTVSALGLMGLLLVAVRRFRKA